MAISRRPGPCRWKRGRIGGLLAAAACLLALPPTDSSADPAIWPDEGCNSRRTNCADVLGPAAGARLGWTSQIEVYRDGLRVGADGTLYVRGEPRDRPSDVFLLAIQWKGWEYGRAWAGTQSGPLNIRDDGTVVLEVETVRRGYAPDLTLLWEEPLADGPAAGAAGDVGADASNCFYSYAIDGTRYAACAGEPLRAENPPGNILWTSTKQAAYQTGAAIAHDGSLRMASNNGHIYAIDSGDGSVFWDKWTGHFSACIQPVIDAADNTYVAVEDWVYCYSPFGTQRWAYQLPMGGYADEMVLGGDYRLYVRYSDSYLLTLVPEHYPGDANDDQRVDIFDAFALNAAWGSGFGDPAYSTAVDFNMDGQINIFDAFALNSEWGSDWTGGPGAPGPLSAPEPLTPVLLAGGAALIGRRRGRGRR